MNKEKTQRASGDPEQVEGRHDWPIAHRLRHTHYFRRSNPPESGLLPLIKPGADRASFVDFIERMLTYDPAARITPAAALAHPFLSLADVPRVCAPASCTALTRPF